MSERRIIDELLEAKEYFEKLREKGEITRAQAIAQTHIETALLWLGYG